MAVQSKPYKISLGSFAPEVYQAPFPYPYQRPKSLSEDEYTNRVIQDLKNFFA